MICPGCYGNDTLHWTPDGACVCRGCGYEMTPREYRREIEGDYDRWLASPPEEETP